MRGSRRESGGRIGAGGWKLRGDRVAALAVLALGRSHGGPIFLPSVAETKPRIECGCHPCAAFITFMTAMAGTSQGILRKNHDGEGSAVVRRPETRAGGWRW